MPKPAGKPEKKPEGEMTFADVQKVLAEQQKVFEERMDKRMKDAQAMMHEATQKAAKAERDRDSALAELERQRNSRSFTERFEDNPSEALAAELSRRDEQARLDREELLQALAMEREKTARMLLERDPDSKRALALLDAIRNPATDVAEQVRAIQAFMTTASDDERRVEERGSMTVAGGDSDGSSKEESAKDRLAKDHGLMDALQDSPFRTLDDFVAAPDAKQRAADAMAAMMGGGK